jgi:predicted DCC family thiol-disulfide oxidoreductase YuxK
MKIILFDGVCVMCNGFVDFIVKKDNKKMLYFASQQGAFGINLMKEKCLQENVEESIVFIDDETVFLQSTAVLKISSYLGFPWNLLTAFYVVPVFLRDLVYMLIAKNRYRLFGKRKECRIYGSEDRERFLL